MKVLEILITLGGSAVVVKLLDIGYGAFNRWREGKAKKKAEGATLGVETRKLTLDEVGVVITNLRDEVARLTTKVESLEREGERREAEYDALDQKYRALDSSYEELESKYISLLKHVAEIERKSGGKAGAISAESLLSELTGGGKRDDRREDRADDRPT